MRTIKTRKHQANLKTFASVGGASDKMKQGFIKAKEQCTAVQDEQAHSGQEYSANQLTHMMEELNPIAPVMKVVQNAPSSHTAATNTRASRTIRNTSLLHPQKQSYQKTAKLANKTCKQSGRQVKKGVLLSKTLGMSKPHTGQVAWHGKQIFQQTAATTWKTAKLLAKSAKVAIVSTVVAIKSAAALCIVGSSVAILIIVMAALVGMMSASPMGVFFANDSTNERSLSSVIAMLQAEYDDEISAIKDTVTHDFYLLEGEDGITAPLWHEVLPIYAVQTAASSDTDMDVVRVTDANIRLLRQVFWDMHALSYRTEEHERIVEMEVPNEDGGVDVVETVVIDTTLIISLSHLSAEEIATMRAFSTIQREQLAELQAPEYESLWAGLIGGFAH